MRTENFTQATFELRGCRERLSVREWGRNHPSFIALLSHGYGEHSGRYAHVASRLVGEGAVVYGPDHVGHGRSGGERILVESIDDLVKDFGALQQQVVAEHPGLPLVIIGHSMGGLVAARFAQLHPGLLQALVLSGTPVGGNPGFQALLSIDPMPAVSIDPDMLSRDPKVGARYAADPLVWHGPFKRSTLAAIFRAIDDIGAGPNFGPLPVLWLQGEQDALAPLHETEEAIDKLGGTGLRRHVYPGARHEVLNELNSDEVLDDLVSFLRSVIASGH